MRKFWFGAALLSAFAAYTAHPAVALPPDNLSAKVGDLSSRRFIEREAAERELLSQGEKALPALKEGLAKLDSEGKARATRIIERLEKESVNRRLLAPATVKFAAKDVPLSKAVDDFAKATGLPLAFPNGSKVNKAAVVSVDIPEMPLWDAVDRFLAITGLKETVPTPKPALNGNIEYSGRAVRFYGGRQPNPVAKSPILLDEGKPEMRTDNRNAIRVGLAAGVQRVGGSGEIGLSLNITPPASLNMRSVLGVEITKAQDENAQDLRQKMAVEPMPNMNMAYDGGFGGQIQMLQLDSSIDLTGGTPVSNAVPAVLLAGRKPSKTLTCLEGKVHVQALCADEPIVTLRDPKKPAVGDPEKPFQAAGCSIRLSDFNKDAKGSYTIKIAFESSSGNPWGGMQDQEALGEFDFSETGGIPKFACFDKDGKPMTRVDQRIFNQNFIQGPRGFQLQSEIQVVIVPGKENAELGEIRVMGKRIVTISVPFSFKDAPIP